MNASPLEEAALLEGLLQDLPDTPAEREQRFFQAAQYLAEFTGRENRSLPPAMEGIALHLMRDALIELYAGFQLGVFRGLSSIPRAPGKPPAAQLRLEERLKALLWVEAVRAEMFRWFVAGLRHEAGRMLGEQIHRAPPIWEFGRLFAYWSGRLALALEEAFRPPTNKENPEHEFGLYGLHLLFFTSREIRSHEFQLLCNLMSWWVELYPDFPEMEIRDLTSAIAQASLSSEQIEELARRLHSWRSLERYPAKRPFASRREYVRASAQAAGCGKAITALAMLLAPLFHSRPLPLLGGEHQRYRQEINRRWRLASALAALAWQNPDSLPVLVQELDALLEMRANVEAGFLLIEALPAFLKYPHHLSLLHNALDRHRIREFDRLWSSDLQDLRLRLSREALEILLDLVHRFPNTRWPFQILEHAGELPPEAEEWVSHQIRSGGDDILIMAALALYRRLSALQQPTILLEGALRQRLERCLRDNIPIPDHLVRWVLGLRDEGMRRLLLSLAGGLESGSLQRSVSLSAFLRTLGVEVNYADRPNPVKLAACWLIDPDDGLHSGLSLTERLVQAARMMQRNRLDETIVAWLARLLTVEHPARSSSEDKAEIDSPLTRALSVAPRLTGVLNEPIDHRQEFPMRAGASRRLALARALSQAASPERVLPLLAELFDLAVEMFLAWDKADGLPRYFPELCWEADALALETLKAVSQLEPVLPQAVTLLEAMLLAQYDLPEEGFRTTFSVGTITREILPLLAARRISPLAIPTLVERLEQDYPVDEKHAQRIWQCTLQWLSNVSHLNTEQQEVIWNTGYASPLALTRSLALLVLGRQRPISRQTWATVVELLHTSWRQLYQNRAAEIKRLSDRNAWFILGPGDVFLVAGVAAALTAEWFTETNLLNDEQRQALYQAWQSASSDLNHALEARLAESTHPLSSASSSIARGLALSLSAAVGKSLDDDPDWLTRPADLARGLIRQLI